MRKSMRLAPRQGRCSRSAPTAACCCARRRSSAPTRAASPSGWCSGPTARPTASSSPSATATAGGSSRTAKPTARCAASARRCSTAASDADKPVAILSDNSVDHALLALGAMHVGVPVAPISPAYSLMSKDFGKLKTSSSCCSRAWCTPPIRRSSRRRSPRSARRPTPVAELLETNPGSTLERRIRARSRPDTVAKILFTSGSTGMPKGVINTHRMLCANQQMLGAGLAVPRGHAAGGGRLAAVEPHLRRQPQLQHGAAQRRHALHRRRQAGARAWSRPRRATCARSRRRCTSTCRAASTCCCRSSRRTRRCARNFFRDLDMLFYAAAALPQNLWERLEKLARRENGGAPGDALGLGLDRDRAARDRGALPDRARRRDRPAGRRLRAEARARRAASSRCACAGRTSRPATSAAPT